MHPIQQHILKVLILSPSKRYAELKPRSVDSNLFIYHLHKLTDQGLVRKCSDGSYELTSDGGTYADRLSLASFQPRQQPRIVTLLVVRDAAGRYLFYQRRRQPLLGMIGFPYGKIHLGETIAEAAARELLEKTGLTATLTHAGDGYVTMSQNKEPISQILFHLFAGTGPVGTLAKANRTGRPFWSRLEDLTDEPVMPSVPDLIDLVANSTPDRFFAELVYEL